MSRFWAKTFIVILGITNINVVSQARAEEVKWYINDFYPCHILKGTGLGTGYCDAILADVIKSLPQYKHIVEHAVLRKLVSAPDFGEAFCTLQLLKTKERELRFNFTDYFLVAGKNGIYIRDDDERFSPYLVDSTTVSLKAIMQSHKLIMARDVSRTYGRAIDRMIEDAGEDLLQVKVPSDAKFVELLANKRIDYTIAYPTELLDRQTGKHYPFLRFLKISEPQQQDLVHASCTKNMPLHVLQDINNVVLQKRDTLYLKFYQKWWPNSAYIK